MSDSRRVVIMSNIQYEISSAIIIKRIINLDLCRKSVVSTEKELGRSVSVVWSALVVEIFQNVGFTFTVVLGDV